MFVHGPRSSPYTSSNKPPLSVTSFSTDSSHVGSEFSAFTQPNVASSSLLNTVTDNEGSVAPLPSACIISHPDNLPPIIKHIPKSARQAVCSAFVTVLRKIIQDHNDLEAWNALLRFPPSVLCIPPNAGLKVNLCSIIKSRFNPSISIKENYRRKAPRKNSDSSLSAAVSSKMEGGNIKSALRLLCSENEPAQFSDETFLSMQTRHPARVSDMSSLPDPTSFTTTSMSESEV